MFAPRHEVAAAELARVCAPGGLIALATWAPDGLIGQMFTTIGSKMPPLPSYAKPPPMWGDEAHVRSLLEPHGLEVSFEHLVAVFGSDAATVVEQKEASLGPWVMAKAALGDDWPPLRAQLAELYASHETDKQVRADYLITLARKPPA